MELDRLQLSPEALQRSGNFATLCIEWQVDDAADIVRDAPINIAVLTGAGSASLRLSPSRSSPRVERARSGSASFDVA